MRKKNITRKTLFYEGSEQKAVYYDSCNIAVFRERLAFNWHNLIFH